MNFSDKWKILKSKPISSGLNTIRYTEDCVLELFLATDEYQSHIVLIHLPVTYAPSIDSLKNDNLELIFLRDNHCLLIKLIDSEFTGLFDDLISSLIESIKGLTDVITASKVFIETYIKWNVFFVRTTEKALSKDRVIGLWGELSYLLYLINGKSSGAPINRILKSWVGPFDAAHDFEFPEKSLEVKTKLTTSTTIKISSEYQLEQTENKGMELAVISILETESGDSIKDLFLMLKDSILKNGGDFSLILSALSKENLDEQRLSKYCHFLFSRKKFELFDCCLTGFPKILKTELPEAISLVKYSLDTKQLAKYRIVQEVY